MPAGSKQRPEGKIEIAQVLVFEEVRIDSPAGWDRGKSRLPRGRAACVLALLLIAGCSSPPPKPIVRNEQEEAILQVGKAYLDAGRALKRGPANMNELKPYLKKYGDPDKLLISPNDGQPYQVNWGVLAMRPSKKGQATAFVVYEKTGKEGKRYAVDFTLKVRSLTDKEFGDIQSSK